MVRDHTAHPFVRETAAAIARGTGTDGTAQAQLIRRWLARHVRFLRDPANDELLHEPELQLAKLGTQGRLELDCDDVAILAASLGQAIGLRARIVLLGRDGGFEHTWTELCDPNGEDWIECDITRPMQGVDFSLYPDELVVEV